MTPTMMTPYLLGTQTLERPRQHGSPYGADARQTGSLGRITSQDEPSGVNSRTRPGREPVNPEPSSGDQGKAETEKTDRLIDLDDDVSSNDEGNQPDSEEDETGPLYETI